MTFTSRPSLTRPRLTCTALLLIGGLAVACGPKEPADPTTGTGAAKPRSATTVTVTADPDNTLILHVVVRTDEPAKVALQYASADTEQRELTSTSKQQVHEFTVVGLRSQTEYVFAAGKVAGRKIADESSPVSFSTGALPPGVPDVQATSTGKGHHHESTDEGITFFGLGAAAGGAAGRPQYVGVDPEGYVVWYLATSETTARDPQIQHLGNGEVLAFFADSIQHVTLGGEVLHSYDLAAVEGWHHDAVLTPDGGILALGAEVRRVAGQAVRGDTVVELDENGEVVWEWSAFDHLDTTRFPGELSTAQARTGGLDWTHANSVAYDEDADEILLSSRSQGWVVDIDHTTGGVEWIAGASTGTDPSFDAPFLRLRSGTWTTGQHAADWTEDGDVMVYDNRNESGGEENNSRMVVYDVTSKPGAARQVFEYVAPKFTRSLGDVDELSGGNFLVTAGGPGSDGTAHLIEVDHHGEVVWEATTEGSVYQSERVAWHEIARAVMADHDDDGTGDDDPDVPAAIDLTDALLTSTDPSCASYAGEYTSHVTDLPTGRDFTGVLEITADDDVCTLTSNQIPNHDLGVGVQNRPNDPAEVSATFVIPAEPAIADEPTDLTFTVNAVTLNGVTWEAYPAACFGVGPSAPGTEAIGCGGDQLDNPWRYNVGSDLNVFELDDYHAHSQNTGLYHYHGEPVALYEQDCTDGDASPVVGFARDGFPVYGPCFTDDDGTVRPAESSYQVKTGVRQDVAGYPTPTVTGNVRSEEYDGQFIGDYAHVEGAGDLDECNGMTVDGQYGYRLTGEYPYVLGCYSGTPSDDFGATTP